LHRVQFENPIQHGKGQNNENHTQQKSYGRRARLRAGHNDRTRAKRLALREVRGQRRSIDLYFVPKAPAGKEGRGIEIIRGKGWFHLLPHLRPASVGLRRDVRVGEVNNPTKKERTQP